MLKCNLYCIKSSLERSNCNQVRWENEQFNGKIRCACVFFFYFSLTSWSWTFEMRSIALFFSVTFFSLLWSTEMIYKRTMEILELTFLTQKHLKISWKGTRPIGRIILTEAINWSTKWNLYVFLCQNYRKYQCALYKYSWVSVVYAD